MRASRLTLRFVALGYLAVLLLVPVGLVFWRTFEHGLAPVWASVTTPAAIHAFWLTVEVAAIAVPLNAIFGVVAALALVRGRFAGKWLLDALIDLPFKTEVASVFVFGQLENDNVQGAAAVSVVLLVMSFLLLLVLSRFAGNGGVNEE